MVFPIHAHLVWKYWGRDSLLSNKDPGISGSVLWKFDNEFRFAFLILIRNDTKRKYGTLILVAIIVFLDTGLTFSKWLNLVYFIQHMN